MGGPARAAQKKAPTSAPKLLLVIHVVDSCRPDFHLSRSYHNKAHSALNLRPASEEWVARALTWEIASSARYEHLASTQGRQGDPEAMKSPSMPEGKSANNEGRLGCACGPCAPRIEKSSKYAKWTIVRFTVGANLNAG